MAENNTPSTRGLGKQFGASGTQIYHGFITAEEYNRNLVGKNAIRQYDIMTRSDTTVESIVQLVTLPLRSITWSIEPAQDKDGNISDQDKFIADAAEYDMMYRNINWDSFMEEALTFLPFGHAACEKTYEVTTFDGKPLIGTKNLTFLKQTSIRAWETTDQKPGITQQLVNDTANIPLQKLIIFTHKKRGDNYEGISMLRTAYKDWDMKDKLSMVLAVGLEKQAIPIPVLTTPAAPNPTELDNAITLMRQIRANQEAYLKIPDGWKVESLDMSGQTTKEILPAIKYFDHQMQMSALAPFMGLGSNGSAGSRAVGEVQYKPYILQEEAIAREFQNAVQEQWLRQFCDLNFSDMPNGYPQLTHSSISDDNVAELGEYVSKLSSASALTMNFDTENHLRKIGGLPELPEADKAAYEVNRQKPSAVVPVDPTLTPEIKPKPVNPKDVKASAVIEESKQRRQILVKMLDED